MGSSLSGRGRTTCLSPKNANNFSPSCNWAVTAYNCRCWPREKKRASKDRPALLPHPVELNGRCCHRFPTDMSFGCTLKSLTRQRLFLDFSQPLHHGTSRNQVECADPVNGEDCGLWIRLAQSLQCVDTFNQPACWMVRPTNLRLLSPATMPRTPPVGFWRAVIRPNRNPSTTSRGTCAVAKDSATPKKLCNRRARTALALRLS